LALLELLEASMAAAASASLAGDRGQLVSACDSCEAAVRVLLALLASSSGDAKTLTLSDKVPLLEKALELPTKSCREALCELLTALGTSKSAILKARSFGSKRDVA
jgi:hypothetical protein